MQSGFVVVQNGFVVDIYGNLHMHVCFELLIILSECKYINHSVYRAATRDQKLKRPKSCRADIHIQVHSLHECV